MIILLKIYGLSCVCIARSSWIFFLERLTMLRDFYSLCYSLVSSIPIQQATFVRASITHIRQYIEASFFFLSVLSLERVCVCLKKNQPHPQHPSQMKFSGVNMYTGWRNANFTEKSAFFERFSFFSTLERPFRISLSVISALAPNGELVRMKKMKKME